MVTQEEWQRISKLISSGLSVPRVADMVGRSAPTIYRLIALNGPKNKVETRNSKTSKKLIKFEKYLKERVKNGVMNRKKLHAEIVGLGYKGSYSSLIRYLSIDKMKLSKHITAMRFETMPGEQAQVDWGSFGKVIIKGRKERLYSFVYVLGYSRMMFVEFTVKQNLQTFEQCHIHAFEVLGIPKTIVYDNIKTVVLDRKKIASGELKFQYNPAFLDFSRYYGFSIKLCAPYWPRSKGKVEAGVKYIKNNFMEINIKKGFISLKDLNEKVKLWLTKTAHSRIHGTTKEKPNMLWPYEKPFLRSISEFPTYSVSPYLVRNSTKDCMIQYKSNFYSVPSKFTRKKLYVKEINESGVSNIEIYFEGEVIAVHNVDTGKGKLVINDDHHPFSKKNRTVRSNIKKSTILSKNRVDYSRPLSYYSNLNN